MTLGGWPSMLRQLRALTRPVGCGEADAIAVYGRAEAGRWVPAPAADQGIEGVACVDDAARGVHLYSILLRSGGSRSLRHGAERLLRFVRQMQGADGQFHNFILDWTGAVNRDGPTSYAGGAYWTGRAILALVDGYLELGVRECRELAAETMYAASEGEIANCADALAILVQAAARLARSTGDPRLTSLVSTCADRIADCRLGDVLLDQAGVNPVHLWAHEQEIALVEAGLLLGRRSLIHLAARSAEGALLPPAEEGFRRPATCPYEVSCVARGLAEVGRASGRGRLVRAAGLARGWFFGRNPAGLPVYDAARGAFLDGVDNRTLNPDSGAESNVEGARCLLTVGHSAPR